MVSRESVEEYLKVIDEKKDALGLLSDLIWDSPETAFTEHTAYVLQKEYLEKEGFQVESEIAGIATAFSATYGTGGPVVGLLGEFDALANLSQKADMVYKETEKRGGNGHGCGHNMLGVGSIAAALAIKDFLEKTKASGTVIYFGCPGEEGGSGKAFMARAGAFSKCDFALSWHPSEVNSVIVGTYLANIQVLYKFTGISSHASGSPDKGRSALDAVELMNIGTNFLREHIHKDARVHYAITNTGGYSPNVVQADAEVLYLIRAPKAEQLKDIFERVNKIAEGAALMTGTTMESTFIKACSSIIPNTVLEQELQQSLYEVQLPDYSQEELSYAQSFTKTSASGGSRRGTLEDLAAKHSKENKAVILTHRNDTIYNFIVPYCKSAEDKISYGSTDVGDVSWQCPTAQINACTWAPETPAHSWQVVAQGKSEIAHKGLCFAGKVIASTAIRLLENPEIIQEAKKEHKESLDDSQYMAIPDGVEPRPMDQFGL